MANRGMKKSLVAVQFLTRLVATVMLLTIPILLIAQEDSTKVRKKRSLLISFNLVHLTNVDANTSLVVGGKVGFYVKNRWFWGGRAGLIQLNERYFPAVEAPEFGYIGPMLGYKFWQKDN